MFYNKYRNIEKVERREINMTPTERWYSLSELNPLLNNREWFEKEEEDNDEDNENWEDWEAYYEEKT
jgi:hypothetical protein